ncbi:Vacuolar protein sorting-associated protein 11 [Tieghemiomyces parasiticus]|uniref:E3 ubiquitin-protein ligase PEP5 n=1 Tax=Tieghemiomyces parasiticus TaxID=78921 RepID=A0A9W8DHG0_9FUNG|nr:Vacuolar protein sorting-associated protein 11 [Tieghemiomyces parasiticus]
MTSAFRLRRFNFFVQEEIPQLPAVFAEPGLLITSTEGRPGVSIDLGPPPSDGDPGSKSPPPNRTWDASDSAGYLFLGQPASHQVHVVDHRFAVRSFSTTPGLEGSRITFLECVPEANVLLTINESEADTAEPPLVRVWHLDRVFKPDYQPVVVPLAHFPAVPCPVTTLAIHPRLEQLAVGFANGLVTLVRNPLGRERHIRQKVLHTASEPITGLVLALVPPPADDDLGADTAKRPSGRAVRFQTRSGTAAQGTSPPCPMLYITTTSQIVVADLTHPLRETKTILDEEGCALHNSYASGQAELVVARDEAIYFYTPEGRGPCFAFEGPKLSMRQFRDYVVILSRPAGGLDRIYGGESTAAVTAAMTDPARGAGTVQLQVLDMRNKLLAFATEFEAKHVDVVSEWGGLFALARPTAQDDALTGPPPPVLYRLEEKPLAGKLDILYKQNLYPLAVKMATHHQYNPESIAEIYRRYGDYLYSQDDFDGAMGQYLQTVGYVEPSYVIRKFLDAQRLNHLTSYLETLHAQGLATADHTTLLLNCYTKLKDEARLEKFLQQGGEALQFDVETAIRVCRQAGYARQALTLAERFDQPAIYLEIQVEDIGDLARSVQYIADRRDDTPEERAGYVERYGRRLLEGLPDATTDLLIETCAPQNQRESTSNAADGTVPRHPNPRRFQSLFVSHPQHLVRFLETVADRRWGDAASDPAEGDAGDRRAVWQTLLELYLAEWGRNTRLSEATADAAHGERQRAAAKRAMALLRDPHVDYDWDQAFTLCDLAQFDPGTTWLYESREMYQELVQFYMDRDDVETVVQLLAQHGTRDPALYTEALDYFVSSHTVLTTHGEELAPLLAKIEQLNLLPPLQVVQTLSRHSVAQLGLVKDYLVRCLTTERALVDQDERLIASYREETNTMRQEIVDLRTQPVVFQSTKCSSCQAPLDLPSIHFLCKHSYHQRCLGEAEQACPRCATENRLVGEILRNQEATARQHERFASKLEDAPDGFEVVAEYFSKGTFNHADMGEG